MLEIVQDLRRYIDQEYGEVTPKVVKKPPKKLEKVLPKPKPVLDIAIVIHQETPPQKQLLERMGQALEKEKFTVRIAPPGELPEQHVIVTRKTLSAYPLPRTRMFVIEDVDLYLREPAQRRNLWNEILEHVR